MIAPILALLVLGSPNAVDHGLLGISYVSGDNYINAGVMLGDNVLARIGLGGRYDQGLDFNGEMGAQYFVQHTEHLAHGPEVRLTYTIVENAVSASGIKYLIVYPAYGVWFAPWTDTPFLFGMAATLQIAIPTTSAPFPTPGANATTYTLVGEPLRIAWRF